MSLSVARCDAGMCLLWRKLWMWLMCRMSQVASAVAMCACRLSNWHKDKNNMTGSGRRKGVGKGFEEAQDCCRRGLEGLVRVLPNCNKRLVDEPCC